MQLCANAGKRLALWLDVCVLIESGHASHFEVQTYMGSLQWFDLLCRSKLAVYDQVYAFERDRNLKELRTLPASVTDELFMSLLLAPAWSVDLRKPY